MWLLFACTGALLVLTSPAWGQAASPCDHYIPTGQALPRQDTVNGKRLLYSEPTRWGRRVGETVSGDRVSILQECGTVARIRTSDGQEGWIWVRSLPHELQLQQAALHRLPASDQDCQLRFTVPYLIDKCESEVAQRQTRADELTHSIDLAGAALQVFVSGRTLWMQPRVLATGEAETGAASTRTFYRPDGQAFSTMGEGSESLLRGRWQIEGEQLCLPELNGACGKLRRTPKNRVIWGNGGREFIVTAQDGDPGGLVHLVSRVFPYAEPPTVPEALAGLAHPAMGW